MCQLNVRFPHLSAMSLTLSLILLVAAVLFTVYHLWLTHLKASVYSCKKLFSLMSRFLADKILVAKLTELTHSTAKRHVESFLTGLIVISQATGLVCAFHLQPLISENVQRAIKNFTCPVCIS